MATVRLVGKKVLIEDDHGRYEVSRDPNDKTKTILDDFPIQKQKGKDDGKTQKKEPTTFFDEFDDPSGSGTDDAA